MTIQECADRINQKLKAYSRAKDIEGVPLFFDEAERDEIVIFLESLTPYEYCEVFSPLIIDDKSLDYNAVYVYMRNFISAYDSKTNTRITISKKLRDVIVDYYEKHCDDKENT